MTRSRKESSIQYLQHGVEADFSSHTWLDEQQDFLPPYLQHHNVDDLFDPTPVAASYLPLQDAQVETDLERWLANSITNEPPNPTFNCGIGNQELDPFVMPMNETDDFSKQNCSPNEADAHLQLINQTGASLDVVPTARQEAYIAANLTICFLSSIEWDSTWLCEEHKFKDDLNWLAELLANLGPLRCISSTDDLKEQVTMTPTGRVAIKSRVRELLETRFAESPYVGAESAKELSAKTGLTQKSIKIWFANARSRKQKKVCKCSLPANACLF